MAPSPFFILLLPFIILVTLSTPSNSTRVSRFDVISWGCNKDTVSDGGAYLTSYRINIGKIRDYMRDLKFGIHEHGDPPQRMYLLSQCMSDLTIEECGVCWSRATDLLSRCFPATGGRIYLDGCFVRAENYSFYDEAITRYDRKICGSGNESTSQFGNLVKQVTKDIVGRAPNSQGFAVSQKGDHHLTAYGLGICWRTLDEDVCKLCLSDGALSVSGCLPSKEGFALNSGCYLRYSDYAFFSDRGSIVSISIAGPFVAYIMFIAIACVLAITTGYWCGKCIYMHTRGKKQKEKETRAICDDSKFMRFKYSTLQKATSNFDETCKLGVGGYGEVFKGTLPDGREIAIKRLHISGKKPLENIRNEIDVISKCEHKNLVRLLGCCFTNMNSFMVYEFLANTSLDHFLFHPEKKKELDWKKRLTIILGAAEGLEHLHEVCRIIHRDIKASNILLDLRYKPKISDFGLAKFYPDSTKDMPSSSIAGTLGYMAPEYISNGRLTTKIDVYSFGVLILELTSGVPNNTFRSDNSLETLVTRVWQCFSSDKVEEMIDKGMDDDDEEGVERIKRVIQIGLLCTQEAPHLRPPISKVLQMLRDPHLQLPSPTKPPFLDHTL
ncbi:PREDICTED: putative cysteine-rich receptor-like protein kinase 43 [Tarenaya hassleriana]|uniref:putative cysteine-rich receptor-like protein kinase 43 n=1 Tax=Tarenaya hassleriana TaxID=28532 RepID=UPI00053C3315|nr:PREDICTED: putative cysteine-rich receptor-like protein kinase 43 [Tarenaya hassleriana]